MSVERVENNRTGKNESPTGTIPRAGWERYAGAPQTGREDSNVCPLLHAQAETLLSDEAPLELAMYWTSAPPCIPRSAGGGSSHIIVDHLNSTTLRADTHTGPFGIHVAESAMAEAPTTIVNQYAKTTPSPPRTGPTVSNPRRSPRCRP